MDKDKKTSILPTENGPFVVKILTNFSNRHGTVEVKETMALCRSLHGWFAFGFPFLEKNPGFIPIRQAFKK